MKKELVDLDTFVEQSFRDADPSMEHSGPISALPIEKLPVAEQRELANEAIKLLLSRGWIELKAPEVGLPVKMYAVCRKLQNPEVPEGTITSRQFKAFQQFNIGWTEAYIIELLAEAPPGSKKFFPIGHRDVKLAKFDPVEKRPGIANGNFGISRIDVQEWSTTSLPDVFKDGLKLADSTWSTNGVDIICGIDAPSADVISFHTDDLRKAYEKNQIPLTLSWRGKKLGNLLQGLELAILQTRGIKKRQLDQISDELERVLKSIPHTRDEIDLEKVPQELPLDLIAPWIKD